MVPESGTGERMEKGAVLDPLSRATRAELQSMAPVLAIPYIRSFQLPPEEELVLVERECRGKSAQQIAIEQCLSVETVKRRRRAALRKIYQAKTGV